MPQSLIDLFVSSAPLIVFLGIMLFYMRNGGMRARAPSGRTMLELYELQLDEMKHNVAGLERIAVALERRNGA